MIWYENLYLGESISGKAAKIRRIKWKIEHRAGLPNVYIITLCKDGKNLLEMIPARELLQKAYPTKQLYIVGLAKGYQEALETAARIVTDVYRHTGGFQVGQYLLHRRRAGDSV